MVSVFEMTKDLLLETTPEQVPAETGGIDWGSDDNASHHDETAGTFEPIKANEDGEEATEATEVSLDDGSDSERNEPASEQMEEDGASIESLADSDEVNDKSTKTGATEGETLDVRVNESLEVSSSSQSKTVQDIPPRDESSKKDAEDIDADVDDDITVEWNDRSTDSSVQHPAESTEAVSAPSSPQQANETNADGIEHDSASPTKENEPSKVDEEDVQSVHSDDQPKRNVAKKSNPNGDQPDEDDLLRSTEHLFEMADRDTVTVKDICLALQEEFQCKLSKSNRKRVREHLTELIKSLVQPEINESASSEDEREDEPDEEVSDQGDDDSEQSEFEQEDAEDGGDKSKRSSSMRRQNRKGSRAVKSKKKSASAARTARPNRRNAAKVARMVEAERLRKKRIEELKIRNEEMQLNESREDRERAEAISAKFDIDTEEHRLRRLEDRLTLLQLLDKKRIAVIDALEEKIDQATSEKFTPPNPDGKEPVLDKPVEEKVEEKEEEEESDESSSDEEELDIVGITKPFKPLQPLHTHVPSKAVVLLKEIRSPEAKPKKPRSDPFQSSPKSLFKTTASSPTRKHSSRNALQNALKQRQRKHGNLWLARELGYKNEEDHLKDCQSAAEKKRILVQQIEKARVEANERRLLRERILQEGAEEYPPEEDGPRENNETTASPAEEEDEEMLLAQQLTPSEKPVEGSSPFATGHNTTEVNSNDVKTKTAEKENQPEDEISVGENHKATTESSDKGTAAEHQSEEITDETGLNATTGSSSKPQEDETDRKDANSDTEELEISSSPRKLSNDREESTSNGNSSQMTSEQDAEPDSEANIANEAEDDDEEQEGVAEKSQQKPRNAAWQAMLRKEAEMLKKQKKRKKDLVEDQAEEEEEEEVAGLEDFGFSIKKKKADDDEEDADDDHLDEDDLNHVVDELSDDEGDEAAGEAARKKQQQKEEKERHKEIMRRMREGYDGRRGGIAGGGVGARGIHRFDQLVAADNREDAKRLGLLNDDELDSDDEDGKDTSGTKPDDDDDEAALLDKMLKDRFLHRSNVDMEENFSEDEDEAEVVATGDEEDSEAEEERTQERLAKRFTKRARMQRLEEEYADSQEFSQQRLIDEDESMRQELSQMKVWSHFILSYILVSKSNRAYFLRMAFFDNEVHPPPLEVLFLRREKHQLVRGTKGTQCLVLPGPRGHCWRRLEVVSQLHFALVEKDKFVPAF